MKLTLVGAGAMGEALLTGWLAGGHAADDLTIVEPSPQRAAVIEETHGVRSVTLAEAGAADVVVLAVKPHQIDDVLSELSGDLQPSALVVSIAAGTPLKQLEDGLRHGTAVVRVMPNTPALVGEGMAGIVRGSHVSDEQVATVESLMNAVGKSVVVQEKHLDALTSVSGSGPAYLFYIAEAMIEGGVHQGLTRAEATELAVQTFVGSAKLLAESGKSATVLREMVTSPAGTTAAALRVLDDRGVRAAFLEAMEACVRRGQEMAG
ncbi:MAG TPA: pyrroline-5-carboxylate reductase [Tessaracoccus flavescens]|uniref:Pyrroline-5-carboxylate reductase n=1 Tax=Tessaracoccus flavescens TaxID=399497 RepID=A0A921JPL8_9ACTN|nr:pyrroline-5-carboxylate reductase [Tessaracoccus flavescens]